MTPSEMFSNLLTKGQRWKGFKSLVFAVLITSGSIVGAQAGSKSAVGLWEIALERLKFPMIEAEIESLRLDVHRIPCDQNEMILARMVDWNMRIAHEKATNQLWYADWIASNQWNRIKEIDAPCGKN